MKSIASVMLSGMAFAALCPAPLTAQQPDEPQARVEIDVDRTEVRAGESLQLSATVRGTDGQELDLPVTFFATPFDIAHVDPQDVLRTFRQGRVFVFAMVPGAMGEIEIEILPKPPASVEAAPDMSEIATGGVTAVRAVPLTEDGDPRLDVDPAFESLSPEVASIDETGMVRGLAPGRARIRISAEGAEAEVEVRVVENRARRLDVEGPRRAHTGDVVRFTAAAFDDADDVVQDLPVQWQVSGDGASVFPDGGFVAERPGTYAVTATAGEVAATTSIRVAERTHPYRVEGVTHYPFGDIQAAETWVHGDVLYVSTLSDRLYTFDVSDPASPVKVDSVQVDARVVNDITVTADGDLGVMTREGASDRVNGIVFLDLSDPLRPEILSEYTETVTGGVHTVFLVEPHYAFLTDNATGSLRVVEFSDPENPREVARWEVDEAEVDPFMNVAMGQYLHDMHVKDGLAYLAYWRHGLVILDVGDGIRGGSPEDPQLVSRYTYNMADYYPEDWLAGTHDAFRYGDYVFVGDEVFPPDYALTGIESPARIPTLGTVHVIDVSDIENPTKVAEYTVPDVGSHNIIVEDDILYMGYYEGGLRVVDVSGELRGDLRAQGREIGHLWTGSPEGFRPNLPMAWGAKLHRDHILVSDVNSGLWVARLAPVETPPIP